MRLTMRITCSHIPSHTYFTSKVHLVEWQVDLQLLLEHPQNNIMAFIKLKHHYDVTLTITPASSIYNGKPSASNVVLFVTKVLTILSFLDIYYIRLEVST